MNDMTQTEPGENRVAELPRHLILSNAMSAEQQIREMLIEKHKQLKKVQPILEAVTGIDSVVQRYVAQAQSEHLPIPDLAFMEQEAKQAAELPPRNGLRARMERPIMVALAQEALQGSDQGMTLHELMDYLRRHGYPVLNDKTLQGSMIAMIKEPAVFASGSDEQGRKVYRLVNPDERFPRVAEEYREWRKQQASFGG